MHVCTVGDSGMLRHWAGAVPQDNLRGGPVGFSKSRNYRLSRKEPTRIIFPRAMVGVA